MPRSQRKLEGAYSRKAISVALCTYNGERYLQSQLESIAAQWRRPDELVACDDASTDGTVAVLEAFAKAAPFEIRVVRNRANMGSTANFSQAIELCRGELIALCDQDDVWLPVKLERLVSALETSPDAAFAFSNAEMVDAQLEPLGYSLWDANRFGIASRQRAWQNGNSFDLLLRHYVVTGATMAFHSRYRSLILPMPREWVHDAWASLLMAAVAPSVFVPEKLIQYRQHATQQIGERRRSLFDQYRMAKAIPPQSHSVAAAIFRAALERLNASPEFALPPIRRRALELKVKHLDARARMRDNRWNRIPLVLRELFSNRYGKYSLGWKSLAQDLFLP